MLLYPDPFILDPERSFPPSQEVNSPSTIDPYCCYFLSSLPSSPSSFNYNFVFATDALPSNIALETSALPPPDPEAGEERAVPAPPAATKAGRHKRFRTDRHSKIVTSQGLRDRRMRLSLDVARQFFRLQEMLGFDKASHTIDWLLKESRSSIERLAASSRSNNRTLNSDRFITESSASTECEVVFRNSNHKLKPTAAASSKAKVLRPSREVASDPILFTRESREKARVRARERTLEKKRIKSERSLSDAHKMDQLVPSKVTII